MKRVVVTGMAGLSPIGNDWPAVRAALADGASGVEAIEAWIRIAGMKTRLGAPVAFDTPPRFNRKMLRTMGRVAQLAVYVTELALQDAGLADSAVLRSGDCGVAYGSTTGSPEDGADFALLLKVGSTQGVNALKYLRMMSHTAAVNIGVTFGIRGRVVPTSSACTSGSQGIGYGYEAIRWGKQKVMICGGAEELSPVEPIVFETMGEASQRQTLPPTTPRPFDRARDGLVIGEGAATLVLEELEHARTRGARIAAEVIGFGTNSDGAHVTQPNAETMAEVMRLALADAGINAAAVGYINAHGTATTLGDIAESQAVAAVLGTQVPISSLKGNIGHTLGACGALEAWMTIHMQRERVFAPTRNLDEIDPACAPLDYIRGVPRVIDAPIAMTNNFAFGGINTSLILRRWND
jgi:3-oxoacyl-[acyl-carrier-protein] synthase II